MPPPLATTYVDYKPLLTPKNDREGEEDNELPYFVHLAAVFARQNAQAIPADIIQQLPARNMAIPQRSTTMLGKFRLSAGPRNRT